MGMLARVKSLFGGMEGANRGPFSGRGERGHWFSLSSIEDGWQRHLGIPAGEANLDAYACATFYATALAGVQFHHVRMLDNGGMEVVKTSPAARFCRYPNEYQTESDYFLTMIMRLLLEGNAVSYATYDERFAINGVHLASGSRPAVDPKTGSVFYDISGNPMIPIEDIEVKYLVPARQVAHARLYCPRHPLQGVSPVQNAAISAGLGDMVRHSMASFHKNMARPSGIIETDLQLTQDQSEQLRALWEDKSTEWNKGRTPILTSGMKWKPAQMTAVDADIINTLKMTSLDIARVYGIPAALLGIEGAGAVASTEALINRWRAQGLNFVAQHIENSLGRLFQLPANESFRFDLDNLARSEFESKVRSLTTGIQQGLFSPNEARSMVNQPAVKYGDEPRVQAQVVPLSQVEMMNSAPAAPAVTVNPEPDDDAVRALCDQILTKAIS